MSRVHYFTEEAWCRVGFLFLAVHFLISLPGHCATISERTEIVHQGQSSELHLSQPALAVGPSGTIYISWVAESAGTRNLWLSVDGGSESAAIKVNPDTLAAISLHASPSLEVAPDGAVYIAWGGIRKNAGADSQPLLILSRSRDEGKTFDRHVAVGNESVKGPMFEGLVAGADGIVTVGALAWGATSSGPGIWLLQSDGDLSTWKSTLVDTAACPCCRVHMSKSDKGELGIFWRKVFAGNVRDMVLSYMSPNSQAATSPHLLHADRWVLDACPHRGGQRASGSDGSEVVAWYTEGTDETPRILFASGVSGNPVTQPKRLNNDNGWIPDGIGLAVDRDGSSAVIWQEATAARSRIVVSIDKSEPEVLTTTLKATAPAIATGPDSGWVAIWREDSWPVLKTVVARIQK